MEKYYFVDNFTYFYFNFTDCFNMTLLECGLGPLRDPLSTVIPMTLVYGLILMTGVIGNIGTCIVIARNRYMHTATNYYLFSLAISDLLLLGLGLPHEIYQLWNRYPYIFGETVCILRGLTSEMCTNASILTITAFTVERYVAICHPFRAQIMSTLPRVVKTILCIWIFAAVCAFPTAMQFGIKYEMDDSGHVIPNSGMCEMVNAIPHMFEISTGMFYVLPLLIISILYILIGIRLRRASIGNHTDSINDGNHMSKQKMNSRKAVVKMLVAVVISFTICWSPFHAQRLMAYYVEITQAQKFPALEVIFKFLTYTSGITYYLSATMNPILYQLLSVKFRQALKDTFSSCSSCWASESPQDREMTSFQSDATKHKMSKVENKEQLASSVSWVCDTHANKGV